MALDAGATYKEALAQSYLVFTAGRSDRLDINLAQGLDSIFSVGTV
jgi:hypothetical protein